MIGDCPREAGLGPTQDTELVICETDTSNTLSPFETHGLANRGTASLLLPPPPPINKHLSLFIQMVILSTCSPEHRNPLPSPYPLLCPWLATQHD